jgi:hypothetical protein
MFSSILPFAVSLKYGYGLMDADAMVRLAEVWTPVPEQHTCVTSKDGEYKYVCPRYPIVNMWSWSFDCELRWNLY